MNNYYVMPDAPVAPDSVVLEQMAYNIESISAVAPRFEAPLQTAGRSFEVSLDEIRSNPDARAKNWVLRNIDEFNAQSGRQQSQLLRNARIGDYSYVRLHPLPHDSSYLRFGHDRLPLVLTDPAGQVAYERKLARQQSELAIMGSFQAAETVTEAIDTARQVLAADMLSREEISRGLSYVMRWGNIGGRRLTGGVFLEYFDSLADKVSSEDKPVLVKEITALGEDMVSIASMDLSQDEVVDKPIRVARAFLQGIRLNSTFRGRDAFTTRALGLADKVLTAFRPETSAYDDPADIDDFIGVAESLRAQEGKIY